MGEFDGSSVLVAGGAGGLGRAVSLAFHAAGARVTVTTVTPHDVAALEAMRKARGAERLEGVHVDVTDEAAARRLVDGIRARHGSLDVLVNTVGGFGGGKRLWEEDGALLARMLDLNLRSGWALLRAAVPAMLAKGRGAIVNIAAQAGVSPPGGLGPYAASKAAAIALVTSLAADLAGTGVRVNSVLPHMIDTEANRRAMPDADFSKWPKAEEIARVILFLASDAAKLVHGAAVPV
jgi:NAD(P)-dependent dehydrogenase (short-subunit alcohol dehydrogenase family)